jgi:hypothetical protein
MDSPFQDGIGCAKLTDQLQTNLPSLFQKKLSLSSSVPLEKSSVQVYHGAAQSPHYFQAGGTYRRKLFAHDNHHTH